MQNRTNSVAPELLDLIASSDVPKQETSAERAELYMRRLILEGKLRPGQRIPQEAIAKALGSSRIPVREALITLEGEGWLTIETHRGAFVNPFDAQEVRDHYGLYAIIHGLAVERAIERSSPDLYAQLSGTVAGLLAANDIDEAFACNVAFHSTIVTATKSHRFRAALLSLSRLVPGNVYELLPESLELDRVGMKKILAAIKKGDKQKASEYYRKLMEQQGEVVVAAFTERGLFMTDTETTS